MKIPTTGKLFWSFWVLLLVVTLWPSGVFSQGPSAGFTRIGTVNATTTQFTDTTCKIGETCTYQITAANSTGESSPTNTLSITVTGAPPTTQAKMGWTPGVNGSPATEFRIYTGARIPNPPTGLVGVAN